MTRRDDPTAINTRYAGGTLVYEAPCPTCQQLATWFAQPSSDIPRCGCTRPTCNLESVVET